MQRHPLADVINCSAITIFPPNHNPGDHRSIVELVHEYVLAKHGRTTKYHHYYDALRELWPELFITEQPGVDVTQLLTASVRLAVAIFFEIAEIESFFISEENFKRTEGPMPRRAQYRDRRFASTGRR